MPGLGMFQSTPARGRRPIALTIANAGSQFQSTPARGRRRTMEIVDDRGQPVSIHACAGQATRITRGEAMSEMFQSTPARGRRQPDTLYEETAIFMFQSTPARGRRRRDAEDLAQTAFVSIHACAGQATNAKGRYAGKRGRFNPRLRGAGDVSKIASATPASGFQSTPARGRRHDRPDRYQAVQAFQSTPARGRRRFLADFPPRVAKFQSTPARGRRRWRRALHRRRRKVSIHACAGQATNSPSAPRCCLRVSIHAFAGQATGR